MDIKDIKVGENYYWNDPDMGICSGTVTVSSIVGSGQDSIVKCIGERGGEMEVFPNELEFLPDEDYSDSGASDRKDSGGYFGDQPWMYTVLGCSREDFRKQIVNELVRAMAADYVDAIAEKIADDVAQDICDTADNKKWNGCDLRLGIGRVLLKSLGNDES